VLLSCSKCWVLFLAVCLVASRDKEEEKEIFVVFVCLLLDFFNHQFVAVLKESCF